MFEDLRNAWKEAVDNFWRELEEDDDQTGVHGEARKQLSAMRHELSAADAEVRRLQAEVTRARGAAAGERKEEETCRRRLAMAEGIGDAETAQLARTYAERAAERAAVLERKAEALEAEHALRTRDLTEMRATVDAAAAALGAGAQASAAGAGVGAGSGAPEHGPSAEDLKLGDWLDPADPANADRLQRDVEFRRMQKEAREKAAEARLEELKKRMQ
ncbi:MAG TPA: hypothetical protein VF832_19645 [Longimicrobiales bacterium]